MLIAVCFVAITTLAAYGDDAEVPQAQQEDFESGDFSKFLWEHGRDADWSITRQERHAGTYSAQSGSIEDGESTALRVTLDCISGDITFYRKVSSESGFDYLAFYIDGVEQDTWSGDEDWARASFSVEAGARTFEWIYSKDGSVSEGDDAAWIDDVVFPITSRFFIEAGELRATWEDTGRGIRLTSLFDLSTGTEFLGSMPTDFQLFRINLQNTDSKEEITLKSNSGWNLTRIDSIDDLSWLVTCELPMDSRLIGTIVELPIRVDAASNAVHLSLQVHGVPEPWAVKEVKFPGLKLANRGPQTRVLIPQGPGRVLKESFNYAGMYPGSASMPYFAFYDSQGEAGLYVGTHDPWPSRRLLRLGEESDSDDISLSCNYPASNSDQPGNGFEFPGEVVLQLFRGDWYDATLIYRDWVWANAKWYPKLTENGREDTALWMRELPVWARTHNHTTIEDDLGWARQFANIIGLPTGLRWYMWQHCPNSVNDVPHFFPAKPGFHEAIIELKNYNVPVLVMPYINSREWDTRDRGVEDYQFTEIALSGAAKNENGEPIVSTSSTAIEADGSPVQTAIMCPTSNMWREKQKELVLRVVNELGAKAVYMDAITAMPSLCFDHSHGHPTGGGSWWTRSCWSLIENIRRDLPPDCILTSEGTPEAYVHVFDGLMGSWDCDGAVPAFMAIYGGAIQVFARTYNFTPRATLTLAHRIQAGQGFVFGEQTGKVLRFPKVFNDVEGLEFINQIIHLRWELRRFFYAGRMMRPPKLYGSIPTVTADLGNTGSEPYNWVTTDAVLTGAWKIPHEHRLALLFVNVSDEPVSAILDFDAAAYGLPSDELKGTVVVSPIAIETSWGRRFPPPSNPGEPTPVASSFQSVLNFPPRLAWAWIIEPQ